MSARVCECACVCTYVHMYGREYVCTSVGLCWVHESSDLDAAVESAGKQICFPRLFKDAFSALMAPLTQEAVQKWVDDFMKATSGGGDPKCPTDWKRIEELMSKRCTVRNSHRYSDRTHTHRQECSYGHTFTAKGRWRR